ncbi:hypothetical protein NXC14_PC00739 (plasmid) [Rhizobium sp. NXC14]|uniref:hypothetical protein n=1 Tax=Rhizobium sp. NXC14 TaxID=1981173 RepID=UPI000A201960|nr:hypothetical protein [Rhizobium sp. NXC14]ARO34272.1 hypothetical protein NXC14_PC00739 [Rhizobium sp. NXC14]
MTPEAAIFEVFEERRIAFGDAEIAFTSAGEGLPVLMLRGFPQTKALWGRSKNLCRTTSHCSLTARIFSAPAAAQLPMTRSLDAR